MLIRLLIGSELTGILGRSQRVSNRRLREATGWTPNVPSAREGWIRLGPEPGTADTRVARASGI